MAITYEIVVVDASQKPFPPVKDMVKAGVPVAVATRWTRVRREMSPSGLKHKAWEARN